VAGSPEWKVCVEGYNSEFLSSPEEALDQLKSKIKADISTRFEAELKDAEREEEKAREVLQLMVKRAEEVRSRYQKM